jgi:hypothetical protein
MRRLTASLLLAAALAGCGGSGRHEPTPESAYLEDVVVDGSTVRFEFESRPQQVRVRYEPRGKLAECGSGKPVRLRGGAFVVVHFVPAASAKIEGEEVVPTYHGPKRLQGTGPVLEAAKSCDFEADLGWAIGLEQRLPVDVSRDGSTVTVRFGT